MDADRKGLIRDLERNLDHLTNGKACDSVEMNHAIVNLLRAVMRTLATEFVLEERYLKDQEQFLTEKNMIDHCDNYHHHDAPKCHPVNWPCVALAATILAAIYGFLH